MTPEQHQLIEQLYLKMFDVLMAYACSALQSHAQAEEAVQETFRIACQKVDALSESENPEGWLVNTVRNVVRNVIRRNATAKWILVKHQDALKRETQNTEDRICLELQYGNIAELDEYKILKAMAVDGKSQLQIAEEWNISLSACKKRIQRAKEKLRKKLKKDVTL